MADEFTAGEGKPMLTADAVAERVASMRDMRPHDAHIRETDIHRQALQAIADGTADDPQGVAQAALKTLDHKFNRHVVVAP